MSGPNRALPLSLQSILYGPSIFDLESVVLTGDIVERQRDRETQEQKYVIRGRTLSGAAASVVAKFGPSGRAVLITIYLE